MNSGDILTHSQVSILFLVGTVLLSVLLNKLFLSFAKNLGIRDTEETIIRWSSQEKPALGGISFYITFLISAIFFKLLLEPVGAAVSAQFLGLMGATGIAFLMGLSDDAYNTKPLLKFGAQIGCGVVMIVTGTQINLFPSDIANYMFTIFWVVGIMNSINMLDNMDGITTIVSIFVIGSAAMIMMHNGLELNYFFFLLIGVLGSLIGFLVFNWHPSKIYMGDTGSQFLGVFLAFGGIMYFWNYIPSSGNHQTQQVIITMLAFIVPIIDTTTVTINRLSKGKSPFIGGKDHTTHHLSYLGFGDAQIARIFGMISFLSFMLIFVIVNYISNWSYLHAVLFGCYFLIMFTALFSITQLKKNKELESAGNKPAEGKEVFMHKRSA